MVNESLVFEPPKVNTYIHTYVHTYVRTYVRTYVHTYVRSIWNGRVRPWCQAWGRLDFFYRLYFFLPLSLQDGPIYSEILSERAVKPKTTNYKLSLSLLVCMSARLYDSMSISSWVLSFFLLPILIMSAFLPVRM